MSWTNYVSVGLLLALALGCPVFAAETVIISFEQEEGFPPPAPDFIPFRVVYTVDGLVLCSSCRGFRESDAIVSALPPPRGRGGDRR